MKNTSTPYEKYSRKPVNIGSMNDPAAAARVQGLCGDTMEMYLCVADGIIKEASFATDGCGATCACGSLSTELAKGKKILDALGISPKQIIDGLGDLPEDHRHCAILALVTLHRAIADYMLRF
jgi:nitrogen fixation NifU-like protein